MTLRALRHNTKGISAVEFGILAPVLCLLLMGGMDIGHSLYMRANLNGIIERAGRDQSLETGSEATTQAAMDARITQEVRRLHQHASVNFSRTAFTNFSQAQRRHEPFTDSLPHDGVCNRGEPYTDENNNSSWNANVGRSGAGDAKDAVVYTVTVDYKAMFPLWRFLGLANDQVQVVATTVLRNQPFGNQNTTIGTTVRNCPA